MRVLVLHAGSVRDPDGRITGLPEAGKSTLTAALVMAGCDYLGDELVGVRADSPRAAGFPRVPALDETSRHVLEALLGSAMNLRGSARRGGSPCADSRSGFRRSGSATRTRLPRPR